MVKTVIFDIDGTLLDSERIYKSSWVTVGADFGYTVGPEVLRETLGVSVAVAQKLFQKYCGEDFPYDEIQKVRTKLLKELFAATPPEVLRMPYAKQTLQSLKDKGYTLAAASSTPYERTCTNLGHAELYDYFDAIVCGDMVEKGKPEPDIFLKAAELANSTPAECVVVGDTPADVLGATAAGMPVILIPDQAPANDQTTALSRCVLPDLSSVPEVIQTI